MSFKNRTELKKYFLEGEKPTESQFADFIDATINQAEDGIEKKPGEPLRITAENVELTGTITMKNLSTSATLKDNETSSDTVISSQKAVKTYVDTRLPKGLISMWSGAEIPSGWALCDGTNGTPNLSGRFIAGFDQSNPTYNKIGNKGGLEQVTLAEVELPAHTHIDKGHSHSITDPGHHHINNTFNRLVQQTGNNTHRGTDSKNDKGKEFDIRNSAIMKTSKTNISIVNGEANLESTGGNQPHENRPPYFVLAYIMKL